MFQTGFPSIIRSSKLHIQRQVLVCIVLDDCLVCRSIWSVLYWMTVWYAGAYALNSISYRDSVHNELYIHSPSNPLTRVYDNFSFTNIAFLHN